MEMVEKSGGIVAEKPSKILNSGRSVFSGLRNVQRNNLSLE